MQLYTRNNKHNQTMRSSTLRSHQSHPRVNTCARCRKRKPGNPKNPQHCPSCLCPPDVVRSSSGKLRVGENMEEVLARFEEITRDPRETGMPHESMQNARGPLVNGKSVPIRSNPKKSISNPSRQQRKSEHDQVLNALYQDLMGSGLTTEETQGCRGRYPLQGPIKSVRRKSNIRTEEGPGTSAGMCTLQESADLDSDAVLRYFRDYKNVKKPPPSNVLPRQKGDAPNVNQKRGDSRQQDDVDHNPGTSNIAGGEDEDKMQFERDKRELKELSKEVRNFEMEKGREHVEEEEEDDLRWDKYQGKIMPSEEGDQLKRKVSFLPSKLPVPMFPGSQNSRSRSPAGGDQLENVEARTGRRLTSTIDVNGHEEYDQSLDHHLSYSVKELRDSSPQDVKDIPCCHNAPYRCLSAPMPRDSKTEELTEPSETQGIDKSQEQCDDSQLATNAGLPKRYIYAGGDLDLHASKSYIVDLIDRALSRELGTVPEERKAEPAVDPSQSQKEICVEIARALQGDNCSNLGQNKNVQKESPEYVRHLKVLRWDYLNHIQEELKKLQDLERILDTYSPRQSSTVPAGQLRPSTLEQNKNHQGIS